jgi:FtsP/CotA-like multicopper oxidase with cupredoxin domain
MTAHRCTPSRRAVLAGALGSAALIATARWPALAADGAREFALNIGPAEAQIAPSPAPPTRIWSYNGALPGPELRVRQGERLRVTVSDALDAPTTATSRNTWKPA